MGSKAVEFIQVSKRFRLGESQDSLRDLFSSGLARILRRKPKSESQFWALRNVSLSVGTGEAVGIIGPNGAGKSTVLKLLAGILRPDEGHVAIRGRLAALLEVGAGFHGDLTGRENIFLNGAILGMPRAEIRKKLDDIVGFAGIERFLDTPVKRYSSGMYARLGFSIAAHVDPEILLVDEVLSVGDAVFRLRCLDRMHALVRQGTTLVFVTHNLDQMQSICPHAIVLEQGKSAFAGPSREAVGYYMTAMSRAYAEKPTDLAETSDNRVESIELIDLSFSSSPGETTVWVRGTRPFGVRVCFRLRQPIARLVVECNMRASVSENLLSLNSGRDSKAFDLSAGVHTVTLRLDQMPVCGGQYFWNVRMWDADTGATVLDSPFRFPLVVDDEGRATGMMCVDHEWEAAEPDSIVPTYVAASRETILPATTSDCHESMSIL